MTPPGCQQLHQRAGKAGRHGHLDALAVRPPGPQNRDRAAAIGRRGGGSQAGRQVAGIHQPELAASLGELVLDRLGAEEQLDGCFGHGGTGGDRERNSQLLAAEPTEVVG